MEILCWCYFLLVFFLTLLAPFYHHIEALLIEYMCVEKSFATLHTTPWAWECRQFFFLCGKLTFGWGSPSSLYNPFSFPSHSLLFSNFVFGIFHSFSHASSFTFTLLGGNVERWEHEILISSFENLWKPSHRALDTLRENVFPKFPRISFAFFFCNNKVFKLKFWQCSTENVHISISRLSFLSLFALSTSYIWIYTSGEKLGKTLPR